MLSVSKYKAAEIVGILVEKLDNTVIEWQEKFYENDSAVIDHKQGRLFWNGKIQHMNYAIGMPKCLHVILEERGIDAKGMNGDQKREILGSHEDFKSEKSLIER